ncbi:MAG: hypothetical protein ACREIA_26335 [Opitutaceae bacterium]
MAQARREARGGEVYHATSLADSGPGTPARSVHRRVTVQWCINAEGLQTPEIKKSRAALIKFIRSFSYHHNLMARFVTARNPRLQGHEDTIKDVVNNVCNIGRYGAGPSDGVKFNYVGNHQKSGSYTRPDSYSVGSYNRPSPFHGPGRVARQMGDQPGPRSQKFRRPQ